MPSASLAAQLRDMRAGQPTPDAYLRQLVELAGLAAHESEAGFHDLIELQRISLLRRRLNVLERKIDELEASK